MAETTDPTVNPQAQRPGTVKPERTPGSAPSVVPLPAGADPDAPEGSHPLPEDAIDGYPRVADLYEGEEGAPASSPAQPIPSPSGDEKPAPKAETKSRPTSSTGK